MAIRQVPCEHCCGTGRIEGWITRDMAIRAGYPDAEGDGYEETCSHCNGDGWVVEEYEGWHDKQKNE